MFALFSHKWKAGRQSSKKQWAKRKTHSCELSSFHEFWNMRLIFDAGGLENNSQHMILTPFKSIKMLSFVEHNLLFPISLIFSTYIFWKNWISFSCVLDIPHDLRRTFIFITIFTFARELCYICFRTIPPFFIVDKPD